MARRVDRRVESCLADRGLQLSRILGGDDAVKVKVVVRSIDAVKVLRIGEPEQLAVAKAKGLVGFQVCADTVAASSATAASNRGWMSENFIISSTGGLGNRSGRCTQEGTNRISAADNCGIYFFCSPKVRASRFVSSEMIPSTPIDANRCISSGRFTVQTSNFLPAALISEITPCGNSV